ncbi:MAG: ATP-binding cassette domain-containing protein, partial [Rickettsiales bacterium]|nr:ATP-binding cassette domain-containing protein [Rickettsiales bacterium]
MPLQPNKLPFATDQTTVVEKPSSVVSQPSETGISVTNLGKSYSGRPVLRDITLQADRGEVVGLLGPNGAGKTTCFYIITGLVRPDYGSIYFDGEEVTALPMYRRAQMGIGYLPQEASIFRGMSVEDNIL